MFRGAVLLSACPELQAHLSMRKADGLSGLVVLGLEI